MADPRPDAVARHPHLGAAQPPGTIRADFHLHTMWSGDCTTTPDELIGAVVASGLDVVFITDHHAIAGAAALTGPLAELGRRVVVGEEVRAHDGELIGWFLTERVPQGLSTVETAQRIRDQGGLVYVPHPFDPMRRCLAEPALFDLIERGLVDALEVHNAKTSLASLNRRATEVAADAGLAGAAGSDAHVPDALGAAYVELADFDGPDDLLAALATATVVGHHWDRARPWSARVVPSVDS